MSTFEWIATNWLSVIAALFAFGFVVFVHESGHFFMARRVGVRVHEFSLGFGPQLLKHKSGDTEYSLRAVPLGGFVRLEGEDQDNFDPADRGNFQNKTTMEKLGVIVGGCAMNYISATLLFIVIGLFHGIGFIAPAESTIIDEALDGRPAAIAGIQGGDRIVAINGKKTATWKDVTDGIGDEAGKKIPIVVDRKGKELTFQITPEAKQDDGPDGKPVMRGKIGIAPAQQISIQFRPANSFGDIVGAGLEQAYRFTMTPVYVIQSMVRGHATLTDVKKQSGGPLMIGKMLFDAAQRGGWTLLFLWTIISTMVGAFNLLPIPALDGMRALFVAIGAIRRRPIDQEKEALVHTVGLVVLLAVVIMFTAQDIGKLRSGIGLFH